MEGLLSTGLTLSSFKLDGVGPVDNRPFTDKFHKGVVYIQIIRWSKSLCVITEAKDVIRQPLCPKEKLK